MPHIDLLELPYFEGISLDQVVALIDIMQPRQFTANAVIMSQTDTVPPPLYIATRGRVVVSKEDKPGGTNRSLAELRSPTLFGEIELFCQISPVATVRTVEPVSTFVLHRQVFDELFSHKNAALLQFTFNVAKVACRRLAVADAMLLQMLDGTDLVAMRHKITGK